MRLRTMICLLCLGAWPALAADQSARPPASEVGVLVPAMVYVAGLQDLVQSYNRETGAKVTAVSGSMGKIADDSKAAAPSPDVIALPRDLMDALEKEGGILKGSRRHLGRLEIGLLVRTGAPHPDISTVAKLAAVLKAADSLVYSNPARGSIVGAMSVALLNRPEFSGVKGMASRMGDGVDALSRGEAQMAFQLTCEVPPAHPVDNVELVGDLPHELNMHIDLDLAVPARAGHSDAGLAFARYITRPAAAPVWKAKALTLQ